MADHDSQIDTLLERYLDLLDEYTTLRARLATLQSGVHQGIARANFSAERGMRYGQDHYDGRMKASRVLQISWEGDDGVTPCFAVVSTEEDKQPTDASGSKEEHAGQPEEKQQASGKTEKEEEEEKEEGEEAETEEEKARKKEQTRRQIARNPLRWFGVLTPMPLRDAQALSVETVERVIPRLASLSGEMLQLEIEVGRARKKRAKAAASTTATNPTTIQA